jgi:hypothetical protein
VPRFDGTAFVAAILPSHAVASTSSACRRAASGFRFAL